MGPLEAAEFLVEAAATQVLGLDSTGKLFASSLDEDMTRLLQEAVSAAWEAGAISDQQHDVALTYLNRGEPLATAD